MASSQWHQISPILDWILLLRPTSVLDVGSGFGKYGFLCREYLDVFDGRLTPGEWQTRIDGIEIFPSCVTPVHQYVYDHIHIGDACDVLTRLPYDGYDLVLLIDVLEHYDTTTGANLLRLLPTIGRYVIVSTPTAFFPQDETYGNTAQKHLSFWPPRVLRDQGGFIVHRDRIGCVAIFQGRAATVPLAKYLRQMRNRALASRFPRAYRLYNRISR
jgi:SAM-dependent methyltransferase